MPAAETHSERLQVELTRLLELLSPSSILCVGEPAASLLLSLGSTAVEQSLSTFSLAEIPAKLEQLPSCDLAYVHGVIEHLPRVVAGMLLARLRDVSARHLLVHVETGGGWPEHATNWENNDLLAFGLIKFGEYRTGDRQATIYQFNIFDYKLTPEWFNSRQWAHPHLWKP